MNPGDDLNKGFIYLKGFLFLLILLSCAATLLFLHFSWTNCFLLGVIIWSSARLYYFMFYVIEKYVDPSYKFSSVYSVLCYLVKPNKPDEHEQMGDKQS